MNLTFSLIKCVPVVFQKGILLDEIDRSPILHFLLIKYLVILEKNITLHKYSMLFM